MEHHKIKIGITQGDGNGTSYEVILKSFLEQHVQEICTPVVYGSPKIAAYYRKALNINNFSFNPADNVDNVQTGKASLINVLDDTAKVELGSATQASGEAAAVSLERAVADLSAGKLEALVLNPLPAIGCKTLQVSNQFDYVKQKLGANNTMTMLVNGAMRVALLTDARPMRNIAKTITVDNIVGKLHLLADSLKADFAIDNPRIAVLGYNPNCTDAENQEFEEKENIVPAIAQANSEGVLAFGPYDADTMFGTDLFNHFDAVLAIYYTQGMAPFRALSYDDGASYILGIPQMCVAPFQPFGYEEAGNDKAQPDAFQNAVYLACDVTKNRKQYKELTANKLKTNSLSD